MLTLARQQALLQGQQATARKVFEAVPIQEAWPMLAIRQVMPYSLTISHRQMIACLKDLCDAGLVQELPCGTLYRRVPVRQKLAPNKITDAIKENIVTLPTVKTDAPKADLSPLDLLAELSAEVVNLGDEFQKRVRKLAARIEEAALLVEQEREHNAEQMADFAQLQTLLKKLA